MDIATIIGLLLSTALVVVAIILGGSPVIFVDLSSFMIVIGGTIGATLVRNPLAQVTGTAKVGAQAFATKTSEPQEIIARIVELATKARKDGILALEEEPIDDPFLEKGVAFCVDGLKEEEIRTNLGNELRAMIQRHRRGQEILKGMGQAAPAFGMIGTLVGLVQMLAAMDDPSSIGPSMALALLTTLYGAIFANVFCLPLADKLKVRSEEEQLNNILCIDGVQGLAQGVNPKSLEQQLYVFLAASSRKRAAGPEPVPEAKEAAA